MWTDSRDLCPQEVGPGGTLGGLHSPYWGPDGEDRVPPGDIILTSSPGWSGRLRAGPQESREAFLDRELSPSLLGPQASRPDLCPSPRHHTGPLLASFPAHGMGAGGFPLLLKSADRVAETPGPAGLAVGASPGCGPGSSPSSSHARGRESRSSPACMPFLRVTPGVEWAHELLGSLRQDPGWADGGALLPLPLRLPWSTVGSLEAAREL